jgi:tricorn protease
MRPVLLSRCLPDLIRGPLSAGEARLLRFPDIHGDQVAFVHGGDIYTVSAEGGVARRLTSHEGQELYPKFSPDGRWIAFSAEYSGTRQVWVMPAARRHTAPADFLQRRRPDAAARRHRLPRAGLDAGRQHILVRANRTPYGERDGVPLLVPFARRHGEPLGPPETGGGMLSERRHDLRVHAHRSRVSHLEAPSRRPRAERLDLTISSTTLPPAHRFCRHRPPADVGGRTHLLRLRPGLHPQPVLHGHGRRQCPQGHGLRRLRRAVAEFGPQAGRIRKRRLPLAARPRRRRDATHADRGARRPAACDAGLSRMSPHRSRASTSRRAGERAVFGARGEIFTVPAQHGEIRNISRTPEAREISVAWSPDGKWVSYLSDATASTRSIFARRTAAASRGASPAMVGVALPAGVVAGFEAGLRGQCQPAQHCRDRFRPGPGSRHHPAYQQCSSVT